MALWKQNHFWRIQSSASSQIEKSRGFWADIRYWCNFRAYTNQYNSQTHIQMRAKERMIGIRNMVFVLQFVFCRLCLCFVDSRLLLLHQFSKTAYKVFTAIHVNSPIVPQFYGFAWCIPCMLLRCFFSHSTIRLSVFVYTVAVAFVTFWIAMPF